MISSIRCNDFKEEYKDNFSTTKKIRNKECNHYEVSMYLFANNGRFKKYKITFQCKKCEKEEEKEFTENEKIFEYKCPNCQIPIIFSYINTLEDKVDPEELKKKNQKKNEEVFSNKINNYEKLINNEVFGRNKKEECNFEYKNINGINSYNNSCDNNYNNSNNFKNNNYNNNNNFNNINYNNNKNFNNINYNNNNNFYNINYNNNNNFNNMNYNNNNNFNNMNYNNNNNFNYNKNININNYNYFNNPNNYNNQYQNINNNKNNFRTPDKIYNTPDQNLKNNFGNNNSDNNNLSNNNNSFENNHNNRNSKYYENNNSAPPCEINKKLKITLVYNGMKTLVELDSSLSIDEQFHIIQNKMNLKEKKSILFNGDVMDSKKPLSQLPQFPQIEVCSDIEPIQLEIED